VVQPDNEISSKIPVLQELTLFNPEDRTSRLLRNLKISIRCMGITTNKKAIFRGTDIT
jgi:hypothetical protein